MYELVPVADSHYATLYDWDNNEKERELYTCRPLHQLMPFAEYKQNNIDKISSGVKEVFVLVEPQNRNNPLGRIMFFDYNTRNQSKEVGYYIPPAFRRKGLDFFMLSLLLKMAFAQENKLNKVNATTSSCNIQSVGLLQKTGFKLDGRLREHYWINGNKFDQLHYSILHREWCQRQWKVVD